MFNRRPSNYLDQVIVIVIGMESGPPTGVQSMQPITSRSLFTGLSFSFGLKNSPWAMLKRHNMTKKSTFLIIRFNYQKAK